MKYECYLCGKKVETTDMFATFSTHIENEGDIIHTELNEKICSWCAYKFEYLRRFIKEGIKKEKLK
jgi:hypothetical protein